MDYDYDPCSYKREQKVCARSTDPMITPHDDLQRSPGAFVDGVLDVRGSTPQTSGVIGRLRVTDKGVAIE
jgi:hypothetical protein